MNYTNYTIYANYSLETLNSLLQAGILPQEQYDWYKKQLQNSADLQEHVMKSVNGAANNTSNGGGGSVVNPSNGGGGSANNTTTSNGDSAVNTSNRGEDSGNKTNGGGRGSAINVSAGSGGAAVNTSVGGGDASNLVEKTSGATGGLTNKTSGLGGSEVTIGVILGAVAVVTLLLAALIYSRRQTRQLRERGDRGNGAAINSGADKYNSLNSSSFGMETLDHSGDGAPALWEDEALLAARVPFDAITRQQLVSQGGLGEVYRGRFRDQEVAIKTLLPAKRKDLAQIKAFLTEIKFVAGLEHERVVAFVGVAWESLSDVCLVTEFMVGGDLRSLLTSFEASQPPRARGFDEDKVKIALHVAHALTYLHSLEPVVVHRDLKSRNVLLDAEMNAKLTDFGVSRERVDQTMTAGVGSSLWMAPEVVLGERYDEKADIFSFGVVLSELDTQQLPYAESKHSDGSGRQLTQTTVLQLVSTGELTIALTESPLFPKIQSLARRCVALDPTDRPTAGEVLHCLHQARERSKSRRRSVGGLV